MALLVESDASFDAPWRGRSEEMTRVFPPPPLLLPPELPLPHAARPSAVIATTATALTGFAMSTSSASDERRGQDVSALTWGNLSSGSPGQAGPEVPDEVVSTTIRTQSVQMRGIERSSYEMLAPLHYELPVPSLSSPDVWLAPPVGAEAWARKTADPEADADVFTTAAATSRMVSRLSIEVFWIHRNASGSDIPNLLWSSPLARSTSLRVSNRSARSATSASRATISWCRLTAISSAGRRSAAV